MKSFDNEILYLFKRLNNIYTTKLKFVILLKYLLKLLVDLKSLY